MKNIKKLFALTSCLLLTGCSLTTSIDNSLSTDKTSTSLDTSLETTTSNNNYPNVTNVLAIFRGYKGDNLNDVYRRAVEDNKANDYNVNFTTYDLGTVIEMYNSDFQDKLAEKNYDATIVFGEDTIQCLDPTIKVYQGYKFISVDSNQQNSYNNLANFNFIPEEMGYLAGKITADSSSKGKLSYFSTYQNSFDNRCLYGFLQGAKEQNSNIKILPTYAEAEDCYEKIISYSSKLASINGIDGIYGSLSEKNSTSLLEAKGNANVILNYDTNYKEEKASNYLIKDYSKIVKTIISNLANKNMEYKKNYEFGNNGGYIKANNAVEINEIKLLNDENYDLFTSLLKETKIDDSASYTPKYSVSVPFHEANPNCSELNDWKNAPRTGADNATKPVDWKSMGIWSTIYCQDTKQLSSNTGIEFKNMKIYGYSERKGWNLLEHANPIGAFYDENFTNDAHRNFDDRMFNFKDDKRTKILLDKVTKGYNYHPFGSRIDLEALDYIDIKYVISRMDIRLVVWDNAKSIDIDDAKYVANIGGDWWLDKDAMWKPDWSANRDICVAQFRTITRDWKTLYMSSIPVDQYDRIVGDASFLNN